MCHVAGGGGAEERRGGALREVFTALHAPLPVDLWVLWSQVLGWARGVASSERGGEKPQEEEEEWLGHRSE